MLNELIHEWQIANIVMNSLFNDFKHELLRIDRSLKL